MFYTGVRKFIICLLSLFGFLFPLTATSDTLSLVTGEVLAGEVEGIDWKKESLFFRTAGRLESFSFEQVSRVNGKRLGMLSEESGDTDLVSDLSDVPPRELDQKSLPQAQISHPEVKASSFPRWLRKDDVEELEHQLRIGYGVSFRQANLFENRPSSSRVDELHVSGWIVGYQYLGWLDSMAPEIELYRKTGRHCKSISLHTTDCGAKLETKGARLGMVFGSELRKRKGLAFSLVPGLYYERLKRDAFYDNSVSIHSSGGYVVGRASIIAKCCRADISLGRQYAFNNTYHSIGVERESELFELSLGMRFGGR